MRLNKDQINNIYTTTFVVGGLVLYIWISIILYK